MPKASMKCFITSWRRISTALIAQRYNGGGDIYQLRQKARLRPVGDTQGKGCSMCAVKLLGVCLAAYLPLPALAASTGPVPSERALREECSAFSQAGMRDCLAKKAENSRKALRQAEENVARTLSKWDEDRKYVSQAMAKLTASNEDFAKYRDVQCAFSSSLGGGAIGNAIDMRRLACIAELNDRRAAQLRDAVSDLPLK
ncbi:MAG: lysozyme inhibitor LprI family protein [Acetobacter papayae]